jgi:hypothetical protein
MHRLFPAAVVVAAATLGACSLPTIDKEADAKARALFEQVRTQADLAANTDLAPDLRTPQALAQLAGMKTALPPGAPTASALRSWNVYSGTGGSRTNLIHAYSYPGRTVLAETVLTKDKDGAWRIAGFHLTFEDGAPGQGGKPALTVTEKPQDI